MRGLRVGDAGADVEDLADAGLADAVADRPTDGSRLARMSRRAMVPSSLPSSLP
jgi:hypothetical protein